jgi:hypothetical protein
MKHFQTKNISQIQPRRGGRGWSSLSGCDRQKVVGTTFSAWRGLVGRIGPLSESCSQPRLSRLISSHQLYKCGSGTFLEVGSTEGENSAQVRTRGRRRALYWSAAVLCRPRPSSASRASDNYIAEGKIVPAEVTIRLLKQAMTRSHRRRFLIDGFPRLENLQCLEAGARRALPPRVHVWRWSSSDRRGLSLNLKREAVSRLICSHAGLQLVLVLVCCLPR